MKKFFTALALLLSLLGCSDGDWRTASREPAHEHWDRHLRSQSLENR